MNKFEDFIEKKNPNRSKEYLLRKLQDSDGTWFYPVKEIQEQSEAWQARQAEIDALQLELSRTKQVLNNVIEMEVNKNITIIGKIKALINKWKSEAKHAERVASEDFVENTLNECISDLDNIKNDGALFSAHKAKAEDKINTGASLTQHKIDRLVRFISGNNNSRTN